MRRLVIASVSLAATLLAGCEQLGMESPEKAAATREADGKAIGGACRHAGRAIEDCYALNKKAERAAVFAGWREMNDYMRENKIEAVAPQLAAQPSSAVAKVEDEGDTERKADKPAAAKGSKPKAKGHES